VLEEVGIKLSALQCFVRSHIVGELLHLEGIALCSKVLDDQVEECSMGLGGCSNNDGLGGCLLFGTGCKQRECQQQYKGDA